MSHRFNARIGTQTIGPIYHFTEENALLETARGILEMGSDILKMSLNAKAYRGMEVVEGLSLLETACRPEFEAVFDLPFHYYQIWIHPKFGTLPGGMDFVVDDEIEAKLYNEVYHLAVHLLRTYNGSGKTFLLGHWEGDWVLLEGYDSTKNASERNIQGMIQQYKIRQRAVEDARNEISHENVWIGHYAEVNRPLDAKDHGKTRLINAVLPHVEVDLVSYSAYDALWPDRLTEALSYIEAQAQFTDYFTGIFAKKVFVGEYDAYRDYHVHGYASPEVQVEHTRTVIASALAWGAPFVLFWEFYNNEKERLHQGGGFWLIDEEGHKQPVYHLHVALLANMQLLRHWCGYWLDREPTSTEISAWAGKLTTVEQPSELLLAVLGSHAFRSACGETRFSGKLRVLAEARSGGWGGDHDSGEEAGYAQRFVDALSPEVARAWRMHVDSEAFAQQLLAKRNEQMSDEELLGLLVGSPVY